jgi:uroporphyrinogen III methyltransferase/synthase
LRSDLVPAEFVSEEIGRSLIEAARPGDRVLIFRAQEARDVLPQMLDEAGLSPVVVAAYATRTAEDPHFAEKVESADVVSFTSASTVRGSIELLGGGDAAIQTLRKRTIACIGPIAAEAAREAGLRVDVVSERFTAEGLVAALERHFAK